MFLNFVFDNPIRAYNNKHDNEVKNKNENYCLIYWYQNIMDNIIMIKSK